MNVVHGAWRCTVAFATLGTIIISVSSAQAADFQSFLQTPGAFVAITTSGDVWARDADAGCDGIWRPAQCVWTFAGNSFAGGPTGAVAGLAWATLGVLVLTEDGRLYARCGEPRCDGSWSQSNSQWVAAGVVDATPPPVLPFVDLSVEGDLVFAMTAAGQVFVRRGWPGCDGNWGSAATCLWVGAGSISDAPVSLRAKGWGPTKGYFK